MIQPRETEWMLLWFERLVCGWSGVVERYFVGSAGLKLFTKLLVMFCNKNLHMAHVCCFTAYVVVCVTNYS